VVRTDALLVARERHLAVTARLVLEAHAAPADVRRQLDGDLVAGFDGVLELEVHLHERQPEPTLSGHATAGISASLRLSSEVHERVQLLAGGLSDALPVVDKTHVEVVHQEFLQRFVGRVEVRRVVAGWQYEVSLREAAGVRAEQCVTNHGDAAVLVNEQVML